MSERIVLCVPGPWADPSELSAVVMPSAPGWLFVGRVLMEIAARESFVVEVSGADPRMPAAFAAGGAGWSDGGSHDPGAAGGGSATAAAAVADHRGVAYLVDDGGSPERAAAVLRASEVLLAAGGLGVKVETTGVSRSPQQWHELVESRELLGTYRACVGIVRGRSEVVTVGMHALGLPDGRVAADVPGAAALLDGFATYLLLEGPTLVEGETFAPAAGEPGYRLERTPSVDHGGDELLTNPLGAWRLVPLAG